MRRSKSTALNRCRQSILIFNLHLWLAVCAAVIFVSMNSAHAAPIDEVQKAKEVLSSDDARMYLFALGNLRSLALASGRENDPQTQRAIAATTAEFVASLRDQYTFPVNIREASGYGGDARARLLTAARAAKAAGENPRNTEVDVKLTRSQLLSHVFGVLEVLKSNTDQADPELQEGIRAAAETLGPNDDLLRHQAIPLLPSSDPAVKWVDNLLVSWIESASVDLMLSIVKHHPDAILTHDKIYERISSKPLSHISRKEKPILERLNLGHEVKTMITARAVEDLWHPAFPDQEHTFYPKWVAGKHAMFLSTLKEEDKRRLIAAMPDMSPEQFYFALHLLGLDPDPSVLPGVIQSNADKLLAFGVSASQETRRNPAAIRNQFHDLMFLMLSPQIKFDDVQLKKLQATGVEISEAPTRSLRQTLPKTRIDEHLIFSLLLRFSDDPISDFTARPRRVSNRDPGMSFSLPDNEFVAYNRSFAHYQAASVKPGEPSSDLQKAAGDDLNRSMRLAISYPNSDYAQSFVKKIVKRGEDDPRLYYFLVHEILRAGSIAVPLGKTEGLKEGLRAQASAASQAPIWHCKVAWVLAEITGDHDAAAELLAPVVRSKYIEGKNNDWYGPEVWLLGRYDSGNQVLQEYLTHVHANAPEISELIDWATQLSSKDGNPGPFPAESFRSAWDYPNELIWLFFTLSHSSDKTRLYLDDLRDIKILLSSPRLGLNVRTGPIPSREHLALMAYIGLLDRLMWIERDLPVVTQRLHNSDRSKQLK